MSNDITTYQMSAIIGLFRMGNVEAVISCVVNCELWQVQQTIKAYIYSEYDN